MKYFPLALFCAGALLLAEAQHAAGQDAALKAAQRQLSEKGYKLGTPDGFMGKRTEQALRNFQRDKGLEQSGRLNSETIFALQNGALPVRLPAPSLSTEPALADTPAAAPLPLPAAPAVVLAPVLPTIDNIAQPPSPSSAPPAVPKGFPSFGWGWWLVIGAAGVTVLRLRQLSRRPIPAVPSMIAHQPSNDKPPSLPIDADRPLAAADFNPLRPPVSPTEQHSTGRVSSTIVSIVTASNAAAVASAGAELEFQISPIIDGPYGRLPSRGSGADELGGRKAAAHVGTVWVRPDEDVRVKDIVIRGGLFYLGEKLASGTWSEENCLVRPSLPVATPGRASVIEFAYQRHYSHADPPARRAYLEWLASGRDDPATPAGLVALYFFGLEYRMFRDTPGEDGPLLVAEVERLRRTYAGEDWLCRHFDAFLVAARIGMGAVSTPVLTLERTSYLYEIPFDLRVHLGRKLQARQPFDADDALLWIANLPDVYLRTPVLRCRDEFRALWTHRLSELHPGGLKIKAPKKRLKLAYRSASGTFEADVAGPHEALPDIASVSAPVVRLRELLDACTTELEPFSRLLGRKPQARDGAIALLSLPDPLRKSALEARLSDGVAQLLGPAQVTVVPYRKLVSLVDSESAGSDKLPAAMQDQVARILEVLGVAIEPDRRYGGRAADAATHIAVFKATGGAVIDPAALAYQNLRILIEVAMLAAAADGDISDDEMTTVSHIIERHGLAQAETLRLIAFAASLRVDRPKQQGVLRKLLERPQGEREAIARSALAIVMSDGVASAAEVRFLEQLHRALGLSSDDVYGAIHRFTADDQPGLHVAGVSTKEQAIEKVAVDPERLKKLRQETQEVSRLLSDIFVEDSAVEPAAAAAVEASVYSGLDHTHAALLDAIAEADGALSRPAYDDVARRLGLLPDGAIETLNDWAFDRFDEPLIEAETDIMIVPHLRIQLREAKVSP